MFKYMMLAVTVCMAGGWFAKQELSTKGKYIVALGGLPASAGGTPTPSNLASEAAVVKSLPVDGIVINLTNVEGYFSDKIFSKSAPEMTKIMPDIEAYLTLNRGRGTANHDFIRINTAELTADWYDDGAWAGILKNWEVLGSAMAKMGMRGVFLDTEAYNETPFNYKVQIGRTEHDFAGYCGVVRARGRQLAAAIGKHVPDAVIMFTFGPSAAYGQGEKSEISENSMGLVPAFARGFCDTEAFTVIDGYENSYGMRAYKNFAESKKFMTSKKVNSFAGFNGKKKPIKAGFGIWLHRADGLEGTLDPNNFKNNSFTPQEYEHALYYATGLADEYIWVYSVPWKTLPGVYRDCFTRARSEHSTDFVPLVREGEQKAAAYIVSAKGRLDCVDATVFAPLYRTHEEIFDFPKAGWKFRLDPNDAGMREKWYKSGASLAGWRDFEIGDWWEPQLKQTYLGTAWYRTSFSVAEKCKGRKLLLAFGAVDEDAYVYLNGKLIGAHAFGADGWNTPFEFAIDKAINLKTPNELTVRVVSKAGVGGIWKSVKIFSPKQQTGR